MLSLSWSLWLAFAMAPADTEPVPDADADAVESPSDDASAIEPGAADDAPAGDPPVDEDGVAEPDGATAEDGSNETEPPTDLPDLEEAQEAPAADGPAADEAASDAPISSVMDKLEPSEPAPLLPRHRLVYKNLFALRYNPLGLVNENAMGWQMRLYDKRGALWEPAYLGVKLHTFVSPAYSRVGPQVEFSPLAILNLSATYDVVGYYGTFNQMQSFGTPAADFSDSQLERNDKEGASYATYGSLVTLSALLQAKAGPIAVRDNFKAYYNDFKLRDGGNVFYEQTLDILVPDRGWTLTNDLDVLYLFDGGLKLGARYTVTHAVYKGRHFQEGEPVTQPNGPTHRIGPALLYTFYDKPERRFNKPTLIVLTQWWARHRWRTGADVTPALPAIVLGFLFEGDLLPNPRKTYGKKK